MFINLSNHPTAHWNERQTKAAQEYGEIVNIAFPDIPCNATSAEVTDIADRYVSMITKYDNPTVHIMGEMTLTYAIVRRLRAAGITCLASTTSRIKQQLPDGSFISEFRFQTFRNYE